MTIKFSGVLVGIFAVLATASASASPLTNYGHYEWRAGVQAPGPRAPLATSRRVWVSAEIAMTDADTCRPLKAEKPGMTCCVSHSS